MPRSTKILLAVGLILAIAALIFIFFFRSDGTTGNNGVLGGLFGGGSLPPTGGGGGGFGGGSGSGGEGVPVGGTLPVTNEEKQKLIQLTKEPVIGATLTGKDTQTVTYFKRGPGHLFEIAFDGTGGEQQRSIVTITDITGVRWSPKKSSAFLTTHKDGILQNYWLRLTSTSTIESDLFPTPILSADFSPTEERLATLTEQSGQYVVRVSDPNGSRASQIFTSTIPDYELDWISRDEIALKTKTSAFAPTALEIVSTRTRSSTPLPFNNYGADLLWNDTGSMYLASETRPDGRFSNIALYRRDGGDTKIFAVRTLPEKCAFSTATSTVVYCAIPNPIAFEQNTLPDAWWQGKVSLEDQLWRIDTETNSAEMLLGGGGFDMTNLFLSPNENYIFFINKRDSTLWSLRLL